MSKIKVGHFVSFGIGGADKCALNLVRALKRIPEVELQLFSGYYSIPRRIDTHPPGYEPPSRAAQFEEIAHVNYIENAAELASYNIDILHTHRSGSDVKLVPGLTIDQPFKIVETNFHGDLQTPAHKRIFVSKALAAKATGSIGSTEVIPNAIAQPSTAGNFKRELGLEGKFVFGRLARPDNDLYCPVNLEAYAMLQNDNTAFLYVAPSDKARADAVRLKLKNIVFVEPTIDDDQVSKLFNTMDVHCHSNNVGETFGNTIAESMIHGIPTISHRGQMQDWPQAHEEHFDSTPYLYMKSANADAYAYAMHILMTESNTYFNTARAQKHKADTYYDADVVAKAYVKVYQDMIK